MRVELVVNLTQPASTGRHDQPIVNRIGVRQKDTSAQPRFLFLPGERIGKVRTIVTTRRQIVFVTKKTAMELLLFGQVVVDGEAPRGLPRVQNTNLCRYVGTKSIQPT